MKTPHLTGLALAIATGFALPLAGSAQAAMGGALPSTQILPVEQAQFFFLGHNFCWYDDGWQGPGWYWCDYAWNTATAGAAAMAGTAGTAVSGVTRISMAPRLSRAARRIRRQDVYGRQDAYGRQDVTGGQDLHGRQDVHGRQDR